MKEKFSMNDLTLDATLEDEIFMELMVVMADHLEMQVHHPHQQ